MFGQHHQPNPEMRTTGSTDHYLNARLRKELIRPICSTVRNPLQAGTGDLGKYYGPKNSIEVCTWHTLITEKLKQVSPLTAYFEHINKMGFKLQRITQINTQKFSTVNLLYRVKGHWKNNKPGITSSDNGLKCSTVGNLGSQWALL